MEGEDLGHLRPALISHTEWSRQGHLQSVKSCSGRNEVREWKDILHSHLFFFVQIYLGLSDSFVTPWTEAHQAPLSLGFPRQEYWSGLPLPSSGDSTDPRIEPGSPALQAVSYIEGGFFTDWVTRAIFSLCELSWAMRNTEVRRPRLNSCILTHLLWGLGRLHHLLESHFVNWVIIISLIFLPRLLKTLIR